MSVVVPEGKDIRSSSSLADRSLNVRRKALKKPNNSSSWVYAVRVCVYN